MGSKLLNFMLKNNFKYLFLLLFVVIGCAKRGTIDGGLKDTIAPVLKMSFPKNGSVNFSGKEIKLTFDEYVVLKNTNKQLIISPPMKRFPEILPSNASKFITIKIKDTLLPNTTYSFNFGQSIQDNNEGNAYKQFKYVFSTGSYIDSLKLGGTVADAHEKTVDNFVSVFLFEADEKFNDSLVYKGNPRYVTNTLDSLKLFGLENIKAGKYHLVAIKDKNSNNKFDPKEDKIGFRKELISIPNDSVFHLDLFKETQKFKTSKPVQASGNRLFLPYEGNPKNMKVTLKNGETVLPTIITNFPKKDSVQVWFKPLKVDSLQIAVEKDNYSEKYKFKLKDQKKDTLSFSANQNGELAFRDDFSVHSTIPIVKIDNSKIQLINKDSTAVVFTTEYDKFEQNLKIIFKKEPLEKYSFKLFPGAMTDYLDKQNDTLSYKIDTKNTSDYGNLRVALQNVKQFPVILELTDEKGEVKYSEVSDKNTMVEFNLIEPAKYTLRLVYDENNNKEWDTGNYLEKRQSETVIYFPKELDVRANWDVEQPFDVAIQK